MTVSIRSGKVWNENAARRSAYGRRRLRQQTATWNAPLGSPLESCWGSVRRVSRDPGLSPRHPRARGRTWIQSWPQDGDATAKTSSRRRKQSHQAACLRGTLARIDRRVMSVAARCRRRMLGACNRSDRPSNQRHASERRHFHRRRAYCASCGPALAADVSTQRGRALPG
jgi:hypothetical protein